LDRDKANTATDILAVAVDGDDLLDAVCGSWWYKNPTWKRFDIPGCSKRFRVGQRVRLLRK
jgi:hypothetical protein